MKKIYNYKNKTDASKVMSQLLRFPEQIDSRMDQNICKITVTSYTAKDNIKPAFKEQYKNEHLYQIQILDIPEKEFVVFESLLENLDAIVVIDQ